MGFLITILIIVVVWRLLRLFFPFILFSLVQRQQRRWGNQFGGQQGQGFSDPRQGASQGRGSNGNSSQRNGEVRIDVSHRAEKQVSKNVGESVDFEEIKD